MGSRPMSQGTSTELILSSISVGCLFENSFMSVHPLNIFFRSAEKKIVHRIDGAKSDDVKIFKLE